MSALATYWLLTDASINHHAGWSSPVEERQNVDPESCLHSITRMIKVGLDILCPLTPFELMVLG